jgi:hypothetical protein
MLLRINVQRMGGWNGEFIASASLLPAVMLNATRSYRRDLFKNGHVPIRPYSDESNPKCMHKK